ncbi:FSH1-domain-containing protein [Nadsonia fulvescens var. elongata DSM 6958]|uniref:FSH1-domain-containing protein n=1 Tax=Nadsonia fulvescens var. elongata DSM 6958 TaxID=857566 RepID=A0A1E3PHC7_9ASCO|nr:FSH1-domain-containing protein [Nadsonia fulvescens var. elongata DSM 6958]
MGGKILCLHGFVQTGSVFARKSSAVRKALKKIGYETVYLTAPVKLQPADLPFEKDQGVSSLGGSTEEEDYRSWWPTREAAPNYYDLTEAFKSVTEVIETQGPFEGILGFSQGAGFAGLLCNHIHKLHASQPPLSFAIFYSGFRVLVEQHQQYYEGGINIPTLHILGSLDSVVPDERSAKLVNICNEANRTVFTHPGGHFVPNTKNAVNVLVSWLTKLEEAKVENEKDSVNDDDWDAFDNIGKV